MFQCFRSVSYCKHILKTTNGKAASSMNTRLLQFHYGLKKNKKDFTELIFPILIETCPIIINKQEVDFDANKFFYELAPLIISMLQMRANLLTVNPKETAPSSVDL